MNRLSALTSNEPHNFYCDFKTFFYVRSARRKNKENFFIIFLYARGNSIVEMFLAQQSLSRSPSIGDGS